MRIHGIIYFSLLFPISLQGEERLAAAIQAYELEYRVKVGDAYESRVRKLNGQLDLALEGEEKKAIETGDLDLVTAIRAERKSLVEKGVIETEPPTNLPAVLKRFRDAWEKEAHKLDAEKELLGVEINAAFSKTLKELETALTKEAKIDEALAVRKYNEKFIGSSSSLGRTENAAGGSWKKILDGSSLEGWVTKSPESFQTVENGVRARKSKKRGGALLYYVGEDDTPDVFTDFEVRFRLHSEGEQGKANSGFFYHMPESMPENTQIGGAEINIANGSDLQNQTGSIWDVKNVKNSLRGQDSTFELVIRVTADEILVTADGREIMRHDPSKGPSPAYFPKGGAIALQANSTPSAYIFEEIAIRQLPE